MTQQAQGSFRNVVAAVDLSAASEAVLRHARALAEAHGAALTLLYVVPPSEYQFEPAAKLETARREAAAKLEKLAAGLTAGGQPARTLVENGEVAHVVDQVIGREKFDALVLGSAGRRGLNRFVMGSVAEEIFRSMSIPVITIGPKAAQRGPRPVKQILVPTDFSAESQAAMPWAAALAQRYHAGLALVHVVPAVMGEDTESVRRSYNERLRKCVPAGTNVPPELLVKFGDAEDQILAAAEERRADLIVIGIRGGGGFDRARTHLLGPTTTSVIAQAACPVLTIRPGA